MAQKVAVVGLGRFGMAVARSLAAANVQVIAIDTNPDLVDDIKDVADVAVVLDSTDERALRSQELQKVDALVVAIGEDFEAALLTAVIAKRLQIPRVIVRATTSVHAQIFQQIGADEVLQPESEIGVQLARRLANPSLEDFIDLGEGFNFVEMHSPRAFHTKTLRDLNLRSRYGVNLVAIRRSVVQTGRNGDSRVQHTIAVPQPDDVIEPEDILLMIGATEALAKLPRE